MLNERIMFTEQFNIYKNLYWFVDFECLFDEQQKPVDVLSWPQVEKTGNCQKLVTAVIMNIVAMMFQNVRVYCTCSLTMITWPCLALHLAK